MNSRVYAIIVIYQERWAELPAQPFLELAVKNDICDLMIYDNSREFQMDSFFDDPRVTYIHNQANPGLATAYNQAMKQGQVDHDWLLLLDQDTIISEKFFDELFFMIAERGEEIVALVPQIWARGKQISPVLADRYIDRRAQPLQPGCYKNKVMAINSGACLKISFLSDIGGFNEEFPLDFLDHWLFWRIHQSHQVVCVMDSYLVHDLSVLDYSTLSLARYQSIMTAERVFYEKYDRKNLKSHKRQLLLRLIKQFLKVKNRRFWKISFNELLKKSDRFG